ncbi:MAG: YggU family protein [Acidobacteria bacterium]|nr:YggU family protein [Acidobacteriota bacterium]MBI3656334.1 YggU family protein [Acidobacteriota bacterium]
MIAIREKGDGIILSLKVQPRAHKDEVVGAHGSALKLRIAAPPVAGAANEACLKFLAHWFGVKRAQVTLLAGAGAQNKIVRIDGLTKAAALQKLLLSGIAHGD